MIIMKEMTITVTEAVRNFGKRLMTGTASCETQFLIGNRVTP